tara:strand:- start:276 stop:965 length:690 start_codon:yes stop_codon:yes gene_type:complete
MKRFLLLFFFILLFFSSKLLGHAQHYNKISYLEYDLFLNNKIIGSHKFQFKKKDDFLYVNSNCVFNVKKLGIDIMNYEGKTEEIYKNNQLLTFNSNTKQNNKDKFVKLNFNEDKLNYQIDGSSYNGETDLESVIGSWWNHEIVTKNRQISPISGRIMPQKVKFLGKEKIKINDIDYNALHFHFYSNDDKPLEKKKLNIHIWYDVNTMLWLKSSYEKLGNWEYRLKKVEF